MHLFIHIGFPPFLGSSEFPDAKKVCNGKKTSANLIPQSLWTSKKAQELAHALL
jgi:hypothetical protein